jgi:hypothetical protein
VRKLKLIVVVIDLNMLQRNDMLRTGQLKMDFLLQI